MTYVNKNLEEKFSKQNTPHASKKLKKITSDNVPRNNTSQKNISKKLLIWIILIFAVSFLFSPAVSEPFAVVFYSGPEKIKEIAEKGGMSTHGKALLYSTSPELVDYPTLTEHCPHDSKETLEYGCYLPDKDKIYILNINDERMAPIMIVTAAHEMLHKAYATLDATTKSQINNQLDSFKNSLSDTPDEQKALNEVLKPYTDDQISQDGLFNEMHSFIGTEFDRPIGSALYEYYGQYFYNQHDTVASKNIQKENIADIEAELVKEKNELDQFKVNYLDLSLQRQQGIRSALAYDAYIGDTYTYNENVRRYNSNIPIIQSNIDKYNSMVAAYNNKIRDYNALFDNLTAAQSVENEDPI